MLDDMRESNRVETGATKVSAFDRARRNDFPQTLLRNGSRSRVWLHPSYFPPQSLHLNQEIPVAAADIQQSAFPLAYKPENVGAHAVSDDSEVGCCPTQTLPSRMSRGVISKAVGQYGPLQ
jgi:hypothetical protein